jgi:PadR family transcriptional regulator, regulatory protein PadR
MSPGLPSISATESLILDLLQHGERFGLQLVDESRGALKRGSVYVTLARMEAKGFVASRQEERPPTASGLPRRLYTATGYGLKVRDAYRVLREALALKPVQVRP